MSDEDEEELPPIEFPTPGELTEEEAREFLVDPRIAMTKFEARILARVQKKGRTDRVTKLLLGVIALALCGLLLRSWFTPKVFDTLQVRELQVLDDKGQPNMKIQSNGFTIWSGEKTSYAELMVSDSLTMFSMQDKKRDGVVLMVTEFGGGSLSLDDKEGHTHGMSALPDLPWSTEQRIKAIADQLSRSKKGVSK